MQVSDMIQIKL